MDAREVGVTAEPFTREELIAVRADLAEATAGGTDPILAEAFDVVARLFATIDKLAAQAPPIHTDDAAQYDAEGRLRWAPPTRFDPDDRETWPEDGSALLLEAGASEWEKAWFIGDSATWRGPRWQTQGTYDVHEGRAQLGDLWLPLPPTLGGVQ